MSLRSQRKATALCVASMGLGIGRFKEWNPVSGIHWTSPPCDTLHILPVATLSPSWSFKWSLKLFRPASHFTPLTNRLLQIPDTSPENFDSHISRKEKDWSWHSLISSVLSWFAFISALYVLSTSKDGECFVLAQPLRRLSLLHLTCHTCSRGWGLP